MATQSNKIKYKDPKSVDLNNELFELLTNGNTISTLDNGLQYTVGKQLPRHILERNSQIIFPSLSRIVTLSLSSLVINPVNSFPSTVRIILVVNP